MKPFEWIEARTLAEAMSAQPATVAAAMRSTTGMPSADATVLKAGGIDLLDLMKAGLLTPRRVVSVRALPGLRESHATPQGGLRLGALLTLAQVAGHPLVRTRYRAVAEAAGQAASPQIRQVATLGGNLLQRPRCWYFRSPQHPCTRKGGTTCFAFGGENDYHAIFDHAGCAIVHPSTPATALVAFGARVEIATPQKGMRTVALEDFLLRPAQDIGRENDLRPGEVLTGVVLPPRAASTRSVHLRQGHLDSFDWPLADVAVVLDVEGAICQRAAVVLGAAAPVPYRARAAEQLLAGKRIDEDIARRAGLAATGGAQPLSGNAYKVPIFEALVQRAVLAAAGVEPA
jgi:xanthine dehydrogenase YagS FAD-binding subunit